MTARRARTKLVDLKVSDVDFRETCQWFGINPESFKERLIKARLDREIDATQKKVSKLLERIKKAPPDDLNNLRLFDQLDRLDAKLGALSDARWPAPESAKPSPTPEEDR